MRRPARCSRSRTEPHAQAARLPATLVLLCGLGGCHWLFPFSEAVPDRGRPDGAGEALADRPGGDAPGCGASSDGCVLTAHGLVGVGLFHNCAIDTCRRLWCWGSNLHGELGLGDTDRRYGPRRVGTDRWQQVVGGEWYTCGIRQDGTLWCWGYGGEGVLGQPVKGDLHRPTRVGTAPWTSVTAGRFHACAIKQVDASLWCWGANYRGQVGNGTLVEQWIPTQIGPANAKWRAVSARTHTCAIQDSGTLWCWGPNKIFHVDQSQDYGIGLLGVGHTSEEVVLAPAQVVEAAAAGDWRAVSLGKHFTCALKSTGKLYCWGEGDVGQLGRSIPPGTVQTVPIEVRQSNSQPLPLAQVAAGSYHACGVDPSRGLWCWGGNYDGALGVPTSAAQPGPLKVGEGWDTVIAQYHSCGQKQGELFCWGQNLFGDGSTIPGALGTGQAGPIVRTPARVCLGPSLRPVE